MAVVFSRLRPQGDKQLGQSCRRMSNDDVQKKNHDNGLYSAVNIRRLNPRELQKCRVYKQRANSCIVIEECIQFDGNLVAGVPRDFHRKHKHPSGKNKLKALDSSIRPWMFRVHIIYVPTDATCQFYSARHLKVYPHYSISLDDVNDLKYSAARHFILVKEYSADRNHLHEDGVIVINNLLTTSHFKKDIIKSFDLCAMDEEMRNIEDKDGDRRNTFTSNHTITAQRAGGWHSPHKDLDRYSDTGAIRRMGMTTTMPESLRHITGPGLRMLGLLMKFYWAKQGYNVLDDKL